MYIALVNEYDRVKCKYCSSLRGYDNFLVFSETG